MSGGGGFVDDESVCIIHVSSSLSPLAGHPSPLSGEGERSRYTQHDNQLYLCGQRTAVLHILQYYSMCVCMYMYVCSSYWLQGGSGELSLSCRKCVCLTRACNGTLI